MTVKFVQKSRETDLREKYMDNRRGAEMLAEKRAGRVLESRESMASRAAAPERRLLNGRIPPKPIETKTTSTDKGSVIPAAQAAVVSGVIAATVSTNRVMPLHAGGGTWDVLACYHAIITGNFTGFRLPPVGLTVGQYATGLVSAEFSDQDFDLDPPKQNLMNVRDQDSYALQALARCDQEGLTALLGASDSTIDVLSLGWAGPWGSEEQHFFSVSLEDHIIGGDRYSHAPTTGNLTVTVPPVDVVEAGDHALVDITFLSIHGAKWQALMTRIR